jgi:heme/copper-type cytochrome/quinol oxidase subunit 2
MLFYCAFVLFISMGMATVAPTSAPLATSPIPTSQVFITFFSIVVTVFVFVMVMLLIYYFATRFRPRDKPATGVPLVV